MSIDELPNRRILADVRPFIPEIEDVVNAEGQFDRVDSFHGHQSNRFLLRNVDSTLTETLRLAFYENQECAQYRVMSERKGCHDTSNVIIEVYPTSDSDAMPLELVQRSFANVRDRYQQIRLSLQSVTPMC